MSIPPALPSVYYIGFALTSYKEVVRLANSKYRCRVSGVREEKQESRTLQPAP
jgi:hypothetical protein